MAAIKPDEPFDASCSWSGYNHQGHLAIYFAIMHILELYSNAKQQSITLEDFVTGLKIHFIELEYLEDFAIGEVNNYTNEIVYHSIHQVKNLKEKYNLQDYGSALEGLVSKVALYPTIKEAYLHTTTKVNCTDSELRKYLYDIISQPKASQAYLDKIQNTLDDPDLISELLVTKRGNPGKLKSDLKRINKGKMPNENNIRSILQSLKNEVEGQIQLVKGLDRQRVTCVSIYDKYVINGNLQSYCEVDSVQELIENEIEKSIIEFGLNPAWISPRYKNARYCYLLGKLHEHIIDRNINYQRYQETNTKERKISFDTFYDWLTTDKFDTADEYFFAYKLSEVLLNSKEEFCKYCQNNGGSNCESCTINPAIDKIMQFSFEEMKEFHITTAPADELKLQALSLGDGMNKDRLVDHFYHVIKETSLDFEPDEIPVIYMNSDKTRYVLTTLQKRSYGDNEVTLCTSIIQNSCNDTFLYKILMENNYFISNNFECESISNCVADLTTNCDEKYHEKITNIKDVGIINANTFKDQIKNGGIP